MALPAKNEEYQAREYWNSRYASEPEDASFDWFKTFSQVSDLIEEFIPDKSSRILMLGCGNSTLSEEMWDHGYQNIVNIDYSDVVISKMKAKHEALRPEMQWIEMDIRALTFEPESFDVAFDKGTMDAMLTGVKDVWNPSEEVTKDCNAEVSEVLRILKPNGRFLYLTFGQPHFRKRYLERDKTTLTIKTLGDAFHYYMYIVQKSP